MNKIFSLLILSAFGLLSNAQTIDRTKQPKPGPAPVISIKDPVIFTLPNGMTVLVVENHKLPKVTASLNIDQGPILEGKKGGVMGLMGEMLSEGTTKRSKEKFDEEVDMIGADVNLGSNGGGVSSLTRFFDQAFMLMAEALRNPMMDKAAFEKLQKKTLTGLKSSEKSASAISNRVQTALSYGKNSVLGEFETEESVKALTIADIKTAYKNYITPSRSYLTFVGDINPAQAKALAMKAFGSWTGKKLAAPVVPNAQDVSKSEINFVDLPSAVQGEISVGNLVNNPLSNPDYHALLIANQILGGGAESKLFMNLREKHAFTYGSYSSVGNGRWQSTFSSEAQVRSEKADSAIGEIFSEIENMRKGNITEEEMNIAKAKFNGSFALAMEDPARTATYASNILINKLPKDYYRTFLQKINTVTVKDIQRVSNKYFSKDKSRIVIVGNASKIVPNLSRLGYPVKMYDKYANPIVEKKTEVNVQETSKTTDAVSAFSVIEGYLKAIGGKDELKKINSIKTTFSTEMMGRSFSGSSIIMNPNKTYFEVAMGNMKVMQRSFDGTKGYQAQMGKKVDMDADDIKDMNDEKGVIPQLYYVGADFKILYTGTGKVGNEDAYKIKVTKPSGKTSVEYYSTKTGLLLRDESTLSEEGQEMMQITDFSDYRKVGNIMYPYSITQTVGEQEFPMKLTDVKINEGVTEADFK